MGLRGRKTIEKPDDDHREGELESFTTAFYLHPRKTPFGETHRPRRGPWRMK